MDPRSSSAKERGPAPRQPPIDENVLAENCGYEIVDGQAQGGMRALPLPAFPTGVMRGRFHPQDGARSNCTAFVR